MLRGDLINGLRNLNEIFNESKIVTALRQSIESATGHLEGRSSPIPSLVTAFQVLDSMNVTFREAERSILKITDCENLYKSEWRANLISAVTDADRKGPSDIYSIALTTLRSVEFLSDKILPIIELLDRDTERSVKSTQSLDETSYGSLFLILPEVEGRFSTPTRVIKAIQSVVDLYEVCCALLGQASGDLMVIACDSGSNKLFDFRGLPKAIAEVKSIAIQLFNRIALVKEHQEAFRIKNTADALPILVQINEQEEAGRISREEAEQMRKKLLSGGEAFISTGSTIPEIRELYRGGTDKFLQADRTLLLTGPERKLNSAEEATGTSTSQQVSRSRTPLKRKARSDKGTMKSGTPRNRPRRD